MSGRYPDAASLAYMRSATASPELILIIAILIAIVAVVLIFMSRIARGS